MKRMCPVHGVVQTSISQTTCPRCGRQMLHVGRPLVTKGSTRQKEEHGNG